jgi:hypothetical protein
MKDTQCSAVQALYVLYFKVFDNENEVLEGAQNLCTNTRFQ